MKTILLVGGAVLSGLYTLLALVQLIGVLLTNNPATARGMSEIAASVVPPCIGGVILAVCINAVRRKSPSE